MKKFSIVSNGYDTKEVKLFVDSVSRKTDLIVEKYDEQQKELEKIKDELAFYKNLDEERTFEIDQIKEENKEIKNKANEEAQKIIDKAKDYASDILNDTLIRSNDLEQERERIREEIRIHKENIKKILKEEAALYNKLEKEDIDIEII